MRENVVSETENLAKLFLESKSEESKHEMVNESPFVHLQSNTY